VTEERQGTRAETVGARRSSSGDAGVRHVQDDEKESWRGAKVLGRSIGSCLAVLCHGRQQDNIGLSGTHRHAKGAVTIWLACSWEKRG
jgi:hypothetical protein